MATVEERSAADEVARRARQRRIVDKTLQWSEDFDDCITREEYYRQRDKDTADLTSDIPSTRVIQLHTNNRRTVA